MTMPVQCKFSSKTWNLSKKRLNLSEVFSSLCTAAGIQLFSPLAFSTCCFVFCALHVSRQQTLINHKLSSLKFFCASVGVAMMWLPARYGALQRGIVWCGGVKQCKGTFVSRKSNKFYFRNCLTYFVAPVLVCWKAVNGLLVCISCTFARDRCFLYVHLALSSFTWMTKEKEKEIYARR